METTAFGGHRPRLPDSGGAAAESLRRLPGYLRRYWWLPVLLMVVGSAGQAVYQAMKPALNHCFARLVVAGRMRLPEGSLYTEDWYNYLGTQVEVIKSARLVERVIQRLTRKFPDLASEPVRVTVNVVPKTTVVLISASGKNGPTTKAFLEALIEEYLSYRREIRSQSSGDTLSSLASQFSQQERVVEDGHEELHRFQQTNNLAVLQEQLAGDARYLTKLNSQLADLRLELRLLDLVSREEGMQRLGASTNSSGFNPEAVLPDRSGTGPTTPADYLSAKQQLRSLRLEKEDLSKNLRPEHPKIVRLNGEIEKLDRVVGFFDQLFDERKSATRSRLELEASTVATALGTWEQRIMDANLRMTELSRLKSRVDRAQLRYDRLMNLISTVEVTHNVDQEGMIVLDKPTEPEPEMRSKVVLVLSGGMGLVFGVGLVAFVERVDRRVTSVVQAAEASGLPVLACLPERGGGGRSATGPVSALGVEGGDDYQVAVRRMVVRISSRVAPRVGPRRILVFSAGPGAGATTVAASLARGLAMTGSRVLVLEAGSGGDLGAHFGLSGAAARVEVPALGGDPAQGAAKVGPMLTVSASGGTAPAGGAPWRLSVAAQLGAQENAGFDWVVVDVPRGDRSSVVLETVGCVDLVLVVAADWRTRRGWLEVAGEVAGGGASLVYNRGGGVGAGGVDG